MSMYKYLIKQGVSADVALEYIAQEYRLAQNVTEVATTPVTPPEPEPSSLKDELSKLQPVQKSVAVTKKRNAYKSGPIYELRMAMGVSQSVFANLVGVTQGVVSKWELGKNPPVALCIKRINKVAEQYGLEDMKIDMSMAASKNYKDKKPGRTPKGKEVKS